MHFTLTSGLDFVKIQKNYQITRLTMTVYCDVFQLIMEVWCEILCLLSTNIAQNGDLIFRSACTNTELMVAMTAC